jgi:hypothetical protein
MVDPTYQIYRIAKRQDPMSNSKGSRLIDQKLCESIVVDEGQKELCAEWYSRKKRNLNI